jgi:flagellar biosynthesis protein FlhB
VEKSLAPTPRRLRRALREGDSPISIPFVRAGALLFGALLLPPLAGALRARFDDLLRIALSKPESVTPLRAAGDVTLIASPFMAAAAVAALGLGLIQTRGVVTFRRVLPRLDRMNPGANLTGLSFGLRASDAMRGFLVTIGLLVVATRTLVVAAPDLARSVSGEQGGLETLSTVTTHLLSFSVVALVAIGALDLAIKRAAWIGRWRMSRHDVTEERRESEGDPNVRQARRRAHVELVRSPPYDVS